MNYKKKLLYLKEKNKRKLEELSVQNDLLFQECVDALGPVRLYYEKTYDILELISSFPFSDYGTFEWNKFRGKVYKNLSTDTILNYLDEKAEFLILWDKNVPLVLCNIKIIIKCIDDVSAVSFHTFLISSRGDIVIEFRGYNEFILGICESEVCILQGTEKVN